MIVDDDEASLDGYYGTIFQGDSDTGSDSEKDSEDESSSPAKVSCAAAAEDAFRSQMLVLLQESDAAAATRSKAPGGKTHQKQVEKAKRIIRDAEMGIFGEIGQIAAGVPVDDAVKQFSRSWKQRRQEQRRTPQTLHVVLQALLTQEVQIEMKNDSVITGTLDFVDEAMNCTLSAATEVRARDRVRPAAAAPASQLPPPPPPSAPASASLALYAPAGSTGVRSGNVPARPLAPDQQQCAQHTQWQLQLDSVLVRGTTIRMVLLPRSFRGRIDVDNYFNKQQSRGKAPKLH